MAWAEDPPSGGFAAATPPGRGLGGAPFSIRGAPSDNLERRGARRGVLRKAFLLDPALDPVVCDLVEVVDEQDAVQVVDLVLEDPGQEPTGPRSDGGPT